MTPTLSLALVTKNRPEALRRCLNSICHQTIQPARIIIIDNDVRLSARSTALHFSNKLPILYLSSKGASVPKSRNQAMEHCTTSLLGFVDDDCVLHSRWVETALSKYHPPGAYSLGLSLLYNPESLVARAFYTRQRFWFEYEIKKYQGWPSAFCFDTKNILLHLPSLRKNQIKFDENIIPDQTIDAHTDTDLGLQCQQAKLQGNAIPRLLVWHEEPTSLKRLLVKSFVRGKAGWMLARKWQLEGELVYLGDAKWSELPKRILVWWPRQFNGYRFLLQKYTLTTQLAIFILIKLYDYSYLAGYLWQSRQDSRSAPEHKTPSSNV